VLLGSGAPIGACVVDTGARGVPVADRSSTLTIAALCTAAAGVVHAFASYQHDLSTFLGASMATTAGLQVLAAVALFAFGHRLLVAAVTAINAAALLSGVLAHTTGLPLPGMSTAAEFDAQLVAVLCLETAAVLAATLHLAGAGAPVGGSPRWLVPAAALVAVAVAAPASAVRHDHTDHGHAPGEVAAAADHHGGNGGGAAHADDAKLRYDAFTAGMSEQQVNAALDVHAKWLSDYLMRNGTAGLSRATADAFSKRAMREALSSPEGNGGHGHTGPAEWKPIPDQATRDALATHLAQARAAASKYPTAADATKARYVMVAPFLPGLGAHYLNAAYVLDGVIDASKPEVLLYSSNQPDARVVGVSYLTPGNAATQPEGLAGPNDLFHFHDNLCIVSRMAIPASDAAACTSVGGRISGGFGGVTVWMNHVWVVPGWESPWGLFSSENPEITLAVGLPTR
jgi:hypothetical protein